jgi:hypothetical protein
LVDAFSVQKDGDRVLKTSFFGSAPFSTFRKSNPNLISHSVRGSYIGIYA